MCLPPRRPRAALLWGGEGGEGTEGTEGASGTGVDEVVVVVVVVCESPVMVGDLGARVIVSLGVSGLEGREIGGVIGTSVTEGRGGGVLGEAKMGTMG